MHLGLGSWRFNLLLCIVLSAPLISALISYAFVTFPDASIALDTKGTLLLMIVMLEIFLIGATGIFPLNLNELVRMRGRRSTTWKNRTGVVMAFPCSVRILCEIETAARSYDDEIRDLATEKEVKSTDENELTEKELLEKDLVEEFQREAVNALGLNVTQSEEALARLMSVTGKGICEEAYRRCRLALSPKSSLKIFFEEFGVKAML